MVDDFDEESKSFDNLENVYDGIQNLESTTLDDVKGSHGPVHQYNRMTLRSSGKSRGNLAEAKLLNRTLVGKMKSNQPKELGFTRGEPGPKIEQHFLKGECLNRLDRLIYPPRRRSW